MVRNGSIASYEIDENDDIVYFTIEIVRRTSKATLQDGWLDIRCSPA